MKKIAIISGPALGHVGALLKVALATEAISDIDISFIHPDHKLYASKLTTDKFKNIAIPVNTNSVIDRSISFAEGVEKHFSNNHYNLILQNINPLVWTSLIKFPDTPRAVMTNIFLTAVGGLETAQQRAFTRLRQRINNHRVDKGLLPYSNAYEMYEADRVLLADPTPITKTFHSLPQHYRACGACSWTKDGQLPDEIRNSNNILMFSMGSTGNDKFDHQIVDILKDKIKPDACVYLGNKEMQKGKLFDYTYEWLPLRNISPHCKAVVSQGGTGSTYLSLRNGHPTFVYPHHRNQELLGCIIEEMGLGLCLSSDFDINKLHNMDFAEMQSRATDFAKETENEKGDHEVAKQLVDMIQAN